MRKKENLDKSPSKSKKEVKKALKLEEKAKIEQAKLEKQKVKANKQIEKVGNQLAKAKKSSGTQMVHGIGAKSFVYQKKQYLSSIEQNFRNVFENVINKSTHFLAAQVPLSTIIGKTYYSTERPVFYELNSVVDFAFVNLKSGEIDVLIEINDSTHHLPGKIERDKKVKEICEEVGYPIVTFWLFDEKGRAKGYTAEDIKKELSKATGIKFK